MTAAVLIFFAPALAWWGASFIQVAGRKEVKIWHLPVGILLAVVGTGAAIYYAFYVEWSSAGILVVIISAVPAVLAATVGRMS